MLKQLAFTLMEMLVALTIIGILASVSFPAWQHFLSRQQDKIAQVQLVRSLTYARDEARLLGVETFLSYSNVGIYIRDNQSTLLRHEKMNLSNGQLKVRSYPWYRSEIRFKPKGMLVADDAMFIFCREKMPTPAWVISLSVTGQTSVVLPDQNGLIYDSRKRMVTC